jgi:hypothetical protein
MRYYGANATSGLAASFPNPVQLIAQDRTDATRRDRQQASSCRAGREAVGQRERTEASDVVMIQVEAVMKMLRPALTWLGSPSAAERLIPGSSAGRCFGTP